MPALRRSASSASATPGYWIFTATSRPSSSVARWTWPIEAAANASCSISVEELVDALARVLLLEHLRRPSPTASAAPRCAASPAAPGRSRGTPRAGTRCRRTRRAGRASSPRPSSRRACRRSSARSRGGAPRASRRRSRSERDHVRGLGARVLASPALPSAVPELRRAADPPLRDLVLVGHRAPRLVQPADGVLYPQPPHGRPTARRSRSRRASEFGSRASRRLRREGLVPGVVYGGGEEARAVPGRRRASCAPCSATGSAAVRPRVRRRLGDAGRGQGPAAPPRARRASSTSTASRSSSTWRSRPRRRSSSRAPRRRPGVKEGGVLEHVTREITIEALPTEIPERIPVDVSAMEIGDTLQLDDGDARRRASQFVADDPEEVTIATLSARRESRRSPSPSSRRRPSWSARTASRSRARRRREGEAARRGRGRAPATTTTPARSRAPVAARSAAARRSTASDRAARARPCSSSGSATPARATRAPATTSASRSPASCRAAGSCRGPSRSSAG